MPEMTPKEETMLIAVDEHDQQTGTVEKMAAHRQGVLHRAFSVFVFDPNGRLLMQRRARGKYHSGGLWTNTCCSHPRIGESLLDAAHRRLREEMGFDCPLERVGGFVYRAALGGDLVEHEYDHVLTGRFQGTPTPDPNEVEEWKWESLPVIRSRLAENPNAFTAWFEQALDGIPERAPSTSAPGNQHTKSGATP
jgi:isopentenyl-diphosphate delta-isomerase